MPNIQGATDPWTPLLATPSPTLALHSENDGIDVFLDKDILGDYTYTHVLEQ